LGGSGKEREGMSVKRERGRVGSRPFDWPNGWEAKRKGIPTKGGGGGKEGSSPAVNKRRTGK